MFQAFYNGLSGMFTSSKALNLVSNNVSNMQTPGYKAQDAFLTSLSTRDGNGLGAKVADVDYRFSPGEVTQTGNSTDLFLDGNALFILKDGADYYYTRAGLFSFDSEDNLVDKLSGMKVVGFDKQGNLAPINISPHKSLPFEMTDLVNITGQLTNKTPNYSFGDLSIINAKGESQDLSLDFSYSEDNMNWVVTVKDSLGSQVGSGLVEFEADGTLKVGKNELQIMLPEGQSVTVSFGEPGSLAGLTSLNESPESNISISDINGEVESPYRQVEVKTNGEIVLKYVNGKQVDVGRLALAKVDDFAAFSVKEGHILSSNGDRPEHLKAGEGLDVNVISGALELSNVDLAQEFGDMIVIQRSYQASSRVLSVSNQMLEQLYNSTNG